MKWIVKSRKYNCQGCYSFYLVSQDDHRKISTIINLHKAGKTAIIEQLYRTKNGEKRDFIAYHEDFFNLLRSMGFNRIIAEMIPETAQALKKHSSADMNLLDTEFDPEVGLELTNIEIIL